jgi:hypothetical protein
MWVRVDAVLARSAWRLALDRIGLGWEESFWEGYVEMGFRYHWETNGWRMRI